MSATVIKPTEGRPSSAAEVATRYDTGRNAAIYATLCLLALSLGVARLFTGPWYHVYNPIGVVLLDGWPAEWEVLYYLVHFPTFLGDGTSQYGLAPVHYRVFATLYITTVLHAWTGSAFWSLAVVDLLFWCLAGVAAYHVACRLGADPWAAFLGAALTVASPLLVSNMWAHVLHVAEFASLPLGLWAALAMIDHHRSRWRLAAGLGALLVLLSVTYQYQWLMLPLLVVLGLTHDRLRFRQTLVVVGAAVLLYLLATAVMKGVLAAAGLNAAAAESDAVAQPGALLVSKLVGIRSVRDIANVLPQWYHVQQMARLYHPLVFLTGLAGSLLLPARARWLTLLLTAESLWAMTLYPAPWTAMSAFPLVYCGVGVACRRFGSALTRLAVVAARQFGLTAIPRLDWLAGAASLSIAGYLVALTNRDLVGDARFLIMWWNSYSGRPPV